MKVRFNSDRVVQDLNAGTNREVSYRVGQLVELPDASAFHWITRGVAEPAPDEEPKARVRSKE